MSEPAKKKMVKVKVRFPQKRMKTLMQRDESVGKLSASVPAMVSRSLELFLEELAKRSGSVARRHASQELAGKHVKRAVAQHEDLTFLSDLVKEYEELAQVLPAEDEFDEDEVDVMDLLHEAEEREPLPSKKKRRKKRQLESDSDE